MKQVLSEAGIVALAGTVLALAANAISPRGLNLSRDYFRESEPPPPAPHVAHASQATFNAPSEQEQLAAHFKEKGLQLINSTQLLPLFHDPRYQQGLIIFIDVHDDQHYQEKHIPGAYQFDYYHPGETIGPVLAACQTAQQIIIYCNGGRCEDSELTALMLRDEAHIPGEKLFVYSGGITEWMEKAFPVETGQRNSGKLLDSAKPK